MHRQQWRVSYTGTRLATAAKDKKAYHAGRAQVWFDAKEKVMAEIRESGVEVNESLVDEMRRQGAYSVSNSLRGAPVVAIRDDLVAKLQEAHGKVASHEELVKQYDAWAQMMDAHPETQFQLEHDDWMFFFGK